MRGSLGRQILIGTSALVLLATVGIGIFALLFAYSAEDRVFSLLLESEREFLAAELSAGRPPPEPGLPFVRYYATDALPAALREAAARYPRQTEASGPGGQHFHLSRHGTGGAAIWLVADVEPFLAVRGGYSKIVSLSAMAGLALLACSLALGLWLLARATAPLQRLTRFTATLTPEELPSRFADAYPDNEIGQLAGALQAAFQRIAAFIDREQRFTRDVSHELRTPLAVVRNACELLRQDRVDRPDDVAREQTLQRIEHAAKSMQETVEALLALAREDDPSRGPADVPMLPLIERTIVEHAHLLEHKTVELRVDVDPAWRVRGHEAVLRILLANLLSNAFQYTGSGHIEISGAGDRLRVSDTGEGIPTELRPRILDEHVRGESSAGLGIGLSIVDRLCRRFGWHLDVQSGAGGTTITVAFPASPAA